MRQSLLTSLRALVALGMALAAAPSLVAQRPPPAGGSGSTPSAGAQVAVNEFMTYDSAAKTVHLTLNAAWNNTMGGFNYNGGSMGRHTITFPQGWMVKVSFFNRDAIPHSAIVVLDQKPIPMAPERPDLPRGYTAHLTDGIQPVTGTDEFSFRATKAGNYLIVCGVPGHAPSGMYIRVVVSADAKVPAYQM